MFAFNVRQVSVTFDPQRAFMLPLPAIRTVLVKLTLVYADPKKPLTRYGATVSKTGTVKVSSFTHVRSDTCWLYT
jgi:hypothetical protein